MDTNPLRDSKNEFLLVEKLGTFFIGLLFIYLGIWKLQMNNNFATPYYVLLGWQLLTGIGIVCRLNLARYSILIFSVFSLFFWTYTWITFKLDQPEPLNFSRLSSAVYFMGPPFLYLIFFNLRSVKKIFW